MGLVGSLVAQPWLAAAGQGRNILEMNALYQCAVEQLEKWAQNPLSMFTDGCTVFSTAPEQDKILDSLTTQPYHDDMLGPLKAVITAILEVIQRQLQTQLPGGEFWEACPQLQEQAASCINNNISGERNFAMLDAHLHRAPNISVGKIESLESDVQVEQYL